MAKKHSPKGSKSSPKMLQEVKVTAKRPKPVEKTSRTTFGEVSDRKIDSVRRANPSAGRAIGKGMPDKYGHNTYGPDASTVIKKTVK